MNVNDFKKRTAIVILAYADFESLELALATHAKFSTTSGVDIYILQNGRRTYDCERTYEVAKRYQQLFPKQIKVIDNIPPGIPYFSLKALFDSSLFERYDYIIKLDDDVLVLTPDWTDKLCETYINNFNIYGDKLAYVTSLVNNNPYGFKKIIEYSPELSEEYFSTIAREHFVGCSINNNFAPYRIIEKNRIVAGSNGTIWGTPGLVRWLHKKTTLVPARYIEFAQTLQPEFVNNKERYSINCMLFAKGFWNSIGNGENDDEHMVHHYCLKHNLFICSNLQIPMIHLAFFIQRDEVRELMDSIRNTYRDFLKLPFNLEICANRLIEIENRLRFIEKKVDILIPPLTRQDLPVSTDDSVAFKVYRYDQMMSVVNKILPERTKRRYFIKSILKSVYKNFFSKA